MLEVVSVEFVAVGLRLVVGFTFIQASIPKLMAMDEFATAVANYRLLPSRFVRLVSRVVPPLELVVGLALVAGVATPFVSGVAAGMLAAFACAAGLSLARGRRIECGCSGIAARRQVSWSLVLQDVVLAAAAGFVAVNAYPGDAVSPSGSRGGEVLPTEDVLALVVIASLLVMAETLVYEWRRARKATRTLSLAESTR